MSETGSGADVRIDVPAFDRISAAAALELLRPVCASGAWLDAMIARRPHGTLAAAGETSDDIVAGLSDQQLALTAAANRDELAAEIRRRLDGTLT